MTDSQLAGTIASAMEEARGRDAEDVLARMRDRFVSARPGTIYLNGSSLGRLPAATADRLARMVNEEWGSNLAEARTQWLDLGERIGDSIAQHALGAGPGEVVVGECTSVQLYKLAVAAVRARSERGTIITADDNFPTDRYVLDGVAADHGMSVLTLAAHADTGLDLDALRAALDENVALVSLSLVSYRSSALLDMAEVNRLVHDAGALVLWDLSHAVGAVPIELEDTEADLAVGSGYKHLYGGPGAPAFLYVRRTLQDRLRQPIQGWFGHRQQLEMLPAYEPDPTVRRFQTGFPPVLSLTALAAGVDLIGEAGMDALRAKGLALAEMLQDLVAEHLFPVGYTLASPPDARRRGVHLTLRHADASRIHPLVSRADLAIDHMAPDLFRLSATPLNTRFTDIVEAVDRIRMVTDEFLGGGG
ncbi:aminotransferase class V-fold PLP-dependent enzyme [Sphaerisporangium sp. NPDC005289]|uniref:kynureninase n=1 Tax=Sphaerisporangium sp. NPDC005289 TaxID=3155247 RepID=UPI0033B02179